MEGNKGKKSRKRKKLLCNIYKRREKDKEKKIEKDVKKVKLKTYVKRKTIEKKEKNFFGYPYPLSPTP